MAKAVGGVDLRKIPDIVIHPLQHAYGYAQHPIYSEDRLQSPLIEIDRNTVGRKRLEVIVHEATHMAFPGISEEVVTTNSRYVGRILWHMGYRADEDDMNHSFRVPI